MTESEYPTIVDSATVKIVRFEEDQIYPIEVPSEAGVLADFFGQRNNRLLVINEDMTPEQRKMFSTQDLQVGMLVKGAAILLLWQFIDKQGTPLFTLGFPFDAREVADLDIEEVDDLESDILVDMHIVEASTKRLKCIRKIVMPPAFSLAFRTAVNEQLDSVEGGEEGFDNWCQFGADKLAESTKMWVVSESKVEDAIKKSVRLKGKTVDICNRLSQTPSINWSGTLNEIAMRYEILIRESLPEITHAEKAAICQAYNSRERFDSQILNDVYSLDFHIHEAWHLDYNVKFNLAAGAFDYKDERYIRALLSKIDGWSTAEKIAIIDMTEKFWSRSR